MRRAPARPWLAAAIVVALAPGCAPPPPARTPPPPSANPRREAPRAAVSVELRAPKRAAWISSKLGPVAPTLEVVVTNRASAPADVSDLRVHLEAVREGVSFRCAESVGVQAGTREPTSLGPGESYTFTRAIDCMLPLTGTYAVSVAVSFGRDAWRAPRRVRELALDVRAAGQREPRPLALEPGLWGAIGASPLVVGESGLGSGRIALSLVNASTRPIAVPHLRLALRVYRAGSPFPCEDRPVELSAPRSLAPGQTHREPIEVSCLGLSVPGLYEVVAVLRSDSDEEEELGRLAIEISSDPSRRAPLVR